MKTENTNAVQVQGATIYVLNSSGANRWWASVQPGQDDDGKRISEDECRAIALRLAAAPAADAVASVGRDEDAQHTLDRAADLLEGYAEYIQRVKPDDIEAHPYRPEVEMTAAALRAIAAQPQQATLPAMTPAQAWETLTAPATQEEREAVAEALSHIDKRQSTLPSASEAADEVFRAYSGALKACGVSAGDREEIEKVVRAMIGAKPRLDTQTATKAEPARPEHTTSADCWCQPEVDYVDPDTGVTVYVHKELQ